MVFVTAKLEKRKLIAGILAAAAVVCLLVGFWPARKADVYGGDEAMDSMNAVHGGTVENAEEGAEFLTELGWEVNPEPTASAEVVIPSEFDEVYEKYNEIQKEAGYDLSEHKGEKAMLYTYEVKNHPSGESANANLLVCEDHVVGGDICSASLDGFLHGLCKREMVEEKNGES